MSKNAVLFLSYDGVQRMMGERPVEEDLGKLQLAMVGGVAGAMGLLVLNPFEGMNVQMQAMNSKAAETMQTTTRKYAGTIDCFLQTVQNKGITKGL